MVGLESEDQLDDNLRLFVKPPLDAVQCASLAQRIPAPAGGAPRSLEMAEAMNGATAFVSGAAGHLGREMSRALCGAGAHVILNGRDAARLKDFEGELRAEGFSAERAAFDMMDVERVRDFFARRERLHVLVNNAVSMTPRARSPI